MGRRAIRRPVADVEIEAVIDRALKPMKVDAYLLPEVQSRLFVAMHDYAEAESMTPGERRERMASLSAEIASLDIADATLQRLRGRQMLDDVASAGRRAIFQARSMVGARRRALEDAPPDRSTAMRWMVRDLLEALAFAKGLRTVVELTASRDTGVNLDTTTGFVWQCVDGVLNGGPEPATLYDRHIAPIVRGDPDPISRESFFG